MVGSWNDREKRISINSGKLRAGMGMNIYIPFGGGEAEKPSSKVHMWLDEQHHALP